MPYHIAVKYCRLSSIIKNLDLFVETIYEERRQITTTKQGGFKRAKVDYH